MRKLKIHARLSPREGPERAPRASVSGVLYLEFDGAFFPGENWVDYVLPVLGWWMEGAPRLFQPDQDVKNVFMDGAQAFVLRRVAGSDALAVRLVDGGGAVLDQFTVHYSRYLTGLRGAARSVLREIRDRGLPGSEDVSTLETRLEHLLRLEAEIKRSGLP